MTRDLVPTPEALAIVDEERSWTWVDLDRRAEAIAAALIAAAGDDGRVGLLVPTDATGVAAVHGAARAGVTTVLINPRLTDAEVRDLLDLAGAPELVDPGLIVDTATTSRDPLAGSRPDRRARSELVVATSGTTARPKLARLPLRCLEASAAGWDRVLPPATAWLLSLGLHHVAGIGIVLRAAAAAVPVIVPAAGDAPGLLEAIERARRRGVIVSHASLVAAQLAALLEAAPAVDRPPEGIRAVLVGGGPTPDALLARARTAGWPIVTSYGMTETGSGVVADGRPLPGAEIRIADDGEVQVRGPMVFAGYLDDPAATDAALVGDGWLRTGDLGHLDVDGRLWLDGRRDRLIIRGGENISPAEVEGVLAAHPDVAEVAVVGVPDAVLGQVPVAVIVARDGATPEDTALREHARTRLAGFKVPTRFVRARALPRTGLGKPAASELLRLASADGDGDGRRSTITMDDGQPIALREVGQAEPGEADGPTVVLLHATLSSSDQLLALGRRLGEAARVVLVDRRGSGASPMVRPIPVAVERHVADVLAVLDTLAIARATLVGHSFGGVVSLATAVAHPGRVAGVVAWEPPFIPLAPEDVRRAMADLGARVATTFAEAGSEAAARRFLEAVSGPDAWERLHPRQRDTIGRAGAGALTDVAMGGLTADRLEDVTCPTLILTGDASEPLYGPIATALAARIGPAAELVRLPGLRHMAPITDPAAVADVVIERMLTAPEDRSRRAAHD